MSFLDPILNPLFMPLLNISPFLGVLLLSFGVSLLITVAYKYFTDQRKMKELKDKQKEFQATLKGLRDKPEEMMKVQKEAMAVNLEYMKHSFKPTLITMIPVLLLFAWMAGHLSSEPIYPGERYTITALFEPGVTGVAELMVDKGTELLNNATQTIEATKKNGEATWQLKSTLGEHFVTVRQGETKQTKKVLITTDLNYEDAVSVYQHSDISQIKINYNKLRPLGDFSLFGWQPGWLGLYIIFSLVFSLGLRKLMKLY